MSLASIETQPDNENLRIGQRLRQARQERSISIKALADTSGLSTGMISLIERGLSTPSLRSLRLLASALEMPLAAFFAEVNPDAGQPSSIYVVHKDERRQLKLTPSGVMKQLLTPAFPGIMEIYDVKLDPGGSSGPEFYRHEGGEKAGLVIAGALRLWLEEQPTILRVGDSFRFPSTLSHRFDNPGREIAHIFWVVANIQTATANL